METEHILTEDVISFIRRLNWCDISIPEKLFVLPNNILIEIINGHRMRAGLDNSSLFYSQLLDGITKKAAYKVYASFSNFVYADINEVERHAIEICRSADFEERFLPHKSSICSSVKSIDALMSTDKTHGFCDNNGCFSGSEDYYIDSFNAIKRSENFMLCRWNVIKSIIDFGFVREDTISMVCSNLSKTYRAEAFNRALSMSLKAEIAIENLTRGVNVTKYKFTLEQLRKILFYYKTIVYSTVKDLNRYEQVDYFKTYLKKDDLKYLIPISDSFSDKTSFFKVVDALNTVQIKK